MAVINGLPQLGGGKIVTDLLWTNPNPDVPFPAQNITFPVEFGQYEYLLYEVRNQSDRTEPGLRIAYIMSNQQYDGVMLCGNNTYAERVVTNVNSRTINISVARTQSGGAAITNYIIPLRIWGVSKFKID